MPCHLCQQRQPNRLSDPATSQPDLLVDAASRFWRRHCNLGAGLTGDWAAQPIALYGRNGLSGTYEFFREMVLYDREYKPDVKKQPSSEAVVQMVAGDRYAIGYSGIGYKTPGVRTVPLAIASGTPCYDTSAESVYSRKCALARYLYIYVNRKPDVPLDPLRREFIKYILSKDGQTEAEAGGFYSITNADRESDLKRLGITPSVNNWWRVTSYASIP